MIPRDMGEITRDLRHILCDDTSSLTGVWASCDFAFLEASGGSRGRAEDSRSLTPAVARRLGVWAWAAGHRESDVARKKTPEVLVNVKAQVSGRLRDVRAEIFGEHGGPELARRLNLPARTWYNYETGVTVPAEVLLGFIDQTGANPLWLLTGQGPRFRTAMDELSSDELTPQQLIRRSLDKLEREAAGREFVPSYVSMDVVPLDRLASERPGDGPSLGRVLADRSWIPEPGRTVAARIDDDAMAPVLAIGSVVAVDLGVREPALLTGRMAAVRVRGQAIVRRSSRTGRRRGTPIERAAGRDPSGPSGTGRTRWRRDPRPGRLVVESIRGRLSGEFSCLPPRGRRSWGTASSRPLPGAETPSARGMRPAMTSLRASSVKRLGAALQQAIQGESSCSIARANSSTSTAPGRP